MSLRMTVSSSLRCANCQFSVLKSFAALSNAPLQTPRNAPGNGPRPRATPVQRTLLNTSIRHKSTSARSRDNGPDPEPLVEGVNNAEETTTPTPTPSIPWYLQSESQGSQMSADSPLAARQRLPELPEHSPPMLKILLDRISVDLGLDDLTLLDLRHLNPPAALGSNLIMIIGSARSEKHLHVSADRFCRWLRKEYKYRPYAAGLLGRNELKIKLRRKAKRASTMAAAGASETGALDDGIRTGWICVTVGRVPEADSAPKVAIREDIVGFREDIEGVTIVVQMLVESKRGEVDLESLWNSISQTQRRRQQQGYVDEEIEQEADELSEIEEQFESDIGNKQASLGW